MIEHWMDRPEVVSRADWLSARKELLVKEKQLTRQRDEIDRQRRELPWVRVEKEYVFDGPNGQQTLADLFEGRSQLIVSHFMFGPGLEGGLRGLFLPRRPRRRRFGTSGAPRCFVRNHLPGTVGRDRGIQEAHGLALPVALVVWQ